MTLRQLGTVLIALASLGVSWYAIHQTNRDQVMRVRPFVLLTPVQPSLVKGKLKVGTLSVDLPLAVQVDNVGSGPALEVSVSGHFRSSPLYQWAGLRAGADGYVVNFYPTADDVAPGAIFFAVYADVFGNRFESKYGFSVGVSPIAGVGAIILRHIATRRLAGKIKTPESGA